MNFFHSKYWSNAERLAAIDQLIDMCEPTQVRHMMAVIEPQFQRDFISLLPKEVRFFYLSRSFRSRAIIFLFFHNLMIRFVFGFSSWLCTC